MEMTVEEKQELAVETAELEERRWSVVSFDRCEAGGLTYAEAEVMMADLLAKKFYGLCIVTNDAASRLV